MSLSVAGSQDLYLIAIQQLAINKKKKRKNLNTTGCKNEIHDTTKIYSLHNSLQTVITSNFLLLVF